MNKNHYEERVNRVLDYVTQHLDGDLSLNKLARVSHFSPFHFHRIFHAITGETLNSFVRRMRLERAAQLMKAAPSRRVTDIALDVGFAGLAEFRVRSKPISASMPARGIGARPSKKARSAKRRTA